MKYADVCKNYNCQNEGKCIEKNGAPKCKCPRGYHGNHCEQKCKKLSNYMKCIELNILFYDWNPLYSLILTQGWYEIISDVCYHFACLNRGHCVIENGNPKCSCTPGYSGEHCEVKGKIYFIW